MSRLMASATAHLAALIAASEPSIPTTMRSDDCGWFIASSRSDGWAPRTFPGPAKQTLLADVDFWQGRSTLVAAAMVTCRWRSGDLDGVPGQEMLYAAT